MTAKTIPLSFPVVFGGQTISEVVFRRPKGRDMKLLARLGDISDGGEGEEAKPAAIDEAEVSALMIRATTGISEEVFDELDLMEDIPRLTEAAADFLESIAPPVAGNGEA